MAKKKENNQIDENKISIVDLIAYEQACKLLCSQYEKEIKLNELESKNYSMETIKHNREKYQLYMTIYRKICQALENKVENITTNENN